MCLKQAHYQIPQRYCCKKKTPHLSIFVIYIKFYIPLCIVFKTNICDYTSSTKIKVNNYIDPLFNWFFLIIFNLIFFSKSDSQTRSIKIKRVQLNPVNTNSRYQDLIYIVNQLINFILQLSKKKYWHISWRLHVFGKQNTRDIWVLLCCKKQWGCHVNL